jgi:hypothetical protein
MHLGKLFSVMPWKLHIFLFLTECSVTDRIFTIRLMFFGRKSIREYFMGKSGTFHGFFRMLTNIELLKLSIAFKQVGLTISVAMGNSKTVVYKMSNESIIIIGAGIAGLSAGCYSQMNGYPTQIFEMDRIRPD